jgi:hypothetical protein
VQIGDPARAVLSTTYRSGLSRQPTANRAPGIQTVENDGFQMPPLRATTSGCSKKAFNRLVTGCVQYGFGQRKV